jgi:hypothetical protein
MKLFTGTAPDAGDIMNVVNSKGQDLVAVQSTAATSGTFLIQGRMGADHGWVTLDTLTNNDFGSVAPYPQMRCNATAAAGQCDVDINIQGQPV